MKTNIFFNTPDSRKLNENFAKQFGGKVNLENYSREQLEDMRNKLRTRVSQQEGSAGYNDLLTNETYQKDKAMLQLLNTRIKEMLGEDIKKLKDKMVELSEAKKGVRAPKYAKKAKGTKGDDRDGDGKPGEFDDVQVARMTAGGVPKKKAIAKATKDKFNETAVEEGFDDLMKATKERNAAKPSGGAGVKKGKAYGGTAQTDEKEPAKKEKKVKEESKPSAGMTKKEKSAVVKKARAGKDIGKPGKGFKEVEKAAKKGGARDPKAVAAAAMWKQQAKENFKRNVKMVNESLERMIAEDEEGKAKAITAASDMVNDFTTWMQRVGQYQTKAIIELADAIRADFGLQQAEAFKQAVAPALAATLETLTQQRETISNAVAVLAGEDVPPGEQMGMEPEVGPEEPGMEPAEPDELNAEPAADEFAASDAAAGGPETSGREMRESRFRGTPKFKDEALRKQLANIIYDIYQGAMAGQDMIDDISDELGDLFDQVETSGDRYLKAAYEIMRDQGSNAGGDPRRMANVAKQALGLLNLKVESNESKFARKLAESHSIISKLAK